VADRSLLGPADVSDDVLAGMVAELLDADDVGLVESSAEHVAYDIPSITTAGRYWVRGRATVADGSSPFTLFVKHVHSWARSPQFADVPEEFRDAAERMVPWRTEPLVYRSDLAHRLPTGLAMPRALGVFDLDEKSAAVWLEAVSVTEGAWTRERYERAAYLLGRLAASPRVRELADVGEHDFTVHAYLHGRLAVQLLPVLASTEIWQHPLVAGAFDDTLRTRLQAAGDRATALVDELATTPLATGHGDACPNNLLVVDGGFTLIDYGFWGERPIGFDLSQLVVGDMQIGKRSTEGVAELDDACVTAYVEGLRAEGDHTSYDVVRRAHALQLMIFTGLSAIPLEFLGEPVTAELQHVAAERAAIARFSLDLLDQTSRAPEGGS